MNGLSWDVTISGGNWRGWFIWPELTVSALLKNPLIGNDSLLIGFLQTRLSPTRIKQSQYRSVCVSLGCCLVSLASLFRLIFSFRSQSVPLFNLGAVLEWWVFICLESLSIPYSLSVSLISESLVISPSLYTPTMQGSHQRLLLLLLFLSFWLCQYVFVDFYQLSFTSV